MPIEVIDLLSSPELPLPKAPPPPQPPNRVLDYDEDAGPVSRTGATVLSHTSTTAINNSDHRGNPKAAPYFSLSDDLWSDDFLLPNPGRSDDGPPAKKTRTGDTTCPSGDTAVRTGPSRQPFTSVTDKLRRSLSPASLDDDWLYDINTLSRPVRGKAKSPPIPAPAAPPPTTTKKFGTETINGLSRGKGNDGGHVHNSTGPKSESKTTARSVVESSVSGLLPRMPPPPKRTEKSIFDPIHTTSDPVASSPPRLHSPKAKTKAGFKHQESIIDLSLDDDPFTSSSPPPPVQNNNNNAKNEPRPPPFVGSRVQTHKTFASTTGFSSTKAEAKGKATTEWDHISSSAPEMAMEDDWTFDAQPLRKTMGRSCSDVIDYDLGDLIPDPDDDDDDDDLPDIFGIAATKPGSRSLYMPSNTTIIKPKPTSIPRVPSSKSTIDKELDRQDKAAAKEAEKRRKQLEREEAKEERQRQKERAAALAEVNKVRTDKKVSTPEMIVDLPVSLHPNIKLQVETLLEDLNVEMHGYQSPVKNVVKWRRKVRSRYNEDEGCWEPVPQRIEKEKHAMVIITAAEFVELALGPAGSDLEAHVFSMQQHYGQHRLIYLIEGLMGWMRKNRNARNKHFQTAVRNAAENEAASASSSSAAAAPRSSTQQRKKKAPPKPPPQYIDEDGLEDALVQLQVQHDALIHHTNAPVETAQWVAVFTQHISTIPYRQQRDAVNSLAAFCMDSGQVRTGDGAQDTYVRMLQEVGRVTAPIAWGIVGEYDSVGKLVRGLQKEGPLALESIRKSANKDGAYTDRTVGQAVSRRMYRIFTGRDETSTDI